MDEFRVQPSDASICSEYEELKKKLAKMGLMLTTKDDGFVVFLEKHKNLTLRDDHGYHTCRSMEEVRLVVGVMTDFSAFTVGADVGNVLFGIAANARPKFMEFAEALEKAAVMAPKAAKA